MNLDSTGNRRQQPLSNSIVLNMIVSIGLPLSIVENRSFKHFMSDFGPRYKSYLLLFERLHGKHSGEALATEFDRVIQLHNLNDKIVRLITDNASNNLAAFVDIILPGFEEYFEEFEADVEGSEEENEEDDEGTVEVNGNKYLHSRSR